MRAEWMRGGWLLLFVVFTGGGLAACRSQSGDAPQPAAEMAQPEAGAPPGPPALAAPSTSAPALAREAAPGEEAHRRAHGAADTMAFNTEAYDPIRENPFLSAVATPRSTFSVDVDRASYSNVRRFLLAGQRPPVDAVRIEEMVNYFAYDYPEPGAAHPFSLTTEVGEAPWRPGHRLVRIGLQGRRLHVEDLPPSNLVFLIDVSGSMQDANKLPLVKTALRMLVEQLRARDRIALVVYAGAAGLVLDATPGDRKAEILEALDRLEAGGSTAGGAGLQLAYDVAAAHHLPHGNNRILLATDGDFNVGPSSTAEMVRLVEAKRRQGTFLTVLGFGSGNLNDALMEQLADKGNGHYAYVDSPLEAKKVLVHELGGTLLTIAKDVKVQVEFNPARVQAYRLLGYENRLLFTEDFDDDAVDAGEIGAGHAVTALYEVIPVGVESDLVPPADGKLRYQQQRPYVASRDGDELLYVGVRYKAPEGAESRLLGHAVRDLGGAPSDDFTFAAAVAGFGLLLRDSPYRGALTAPRLRAMARRALGPDPQGYRADFIRLVDAYERLGAPAAEAYGVR